MSKGREGDAHREQDAICEAEEELLSVREGWHAVTPSEPTARLQHLVGGELIASLTCKENLGSASLGAHRHRVPGHWSWRWGRCRLVTSHAVGGDVRLGARAPSVFLVTMPSQQHARPVEMPGTGRYGHAGAWGCTAAARAAGSDGQGTT